MLNRIKNFFDDVESGSPETKIDKNLASAVLMIEAATMDGQADETELATIKNIIMNSFGLDADEADDLLAEASKQQNDANHLLRFTRTIKDTYSEEGRVELIEMLWEVVYADGILHDYEANLLRRIGGLIYVSDRDRGAARKRVLDRLGITE